MTVTEAIRDHLTKHVIDAPVGDKTESQKEMERLQKCVGFERLRMNRMLMGRFRYGLMGSKEVAEYNRIGSAIWRLKAYQETGNLELLVDAANLCGLEFANPQAAQAHFNATDDGQHVAKRVK